MENVGIVNLVIEEIIGPGVEDLMESRYFSELREGKLSIRQLQGFALQHYLHNVAINKGFALGMVKNAHNPDAYNIFAYQFTEEQTHPDLAKRFGLALGLKEEDFDNVSPIFECLAHTSATIRGMFLGSPAESRASGLVNETMVCRYSEEFDIYLRKHYRLGDEACEFFMVHRIADQDHTRVAAEFVTRYTNSPREEHLVREAARLAVRFKLAKFEGIHQAYA